jgi:hypothetical protein
MGASVQSNMEKIMPDAQTQQIPRKVVVVEKIKRRPMSRPLEASTQAAVPQRDVKFPRCDAAVRKMESDEWELAEAILAECSEPGENGVRNESSAKMKAMRQEIATNPGRELSFERIRKLRKVASAFPPGRRRPGVSLEGHLAAGTPETLDRLVKAAAPAGTALTREYIRQQKHPAEKAELDQQKAERRRQREDERAALQNVCKHLERQRDDLAQKYADACRSAGKDPEPVAPPLAPEDERSLTVAEELERAVQRLLAAHGFDPEADHIKKATRDFVSAVLAQAQ